MILMYEIKRIPEDFVVEEITPENEILEIGKKYIFDENSKGDQLICILERNNWDNQLVMKKISSHLGVSVKRIGYAGTKDKRALTSQRISLWGIEKEKVDRVKIKDVEIKPLYYSNKRIELGDLKGNHFRIKVYADKMKKVKKKMNIPNFFGEQRFGKTRPITHLVGEKLINNDVESAVKIYLTKIFDAEADDAKQARKRLSEDYDYKKALEYFPLHLKFERTLIGHLAEYPKDYAGAMRKLPKNLLIMFSHAYQGHLFNKYLELVIKKKKKFKTGPLLGFESVPENKFEEEFIKNNKIDLGIFRVRQMPESSSRGMRRELYITPENLKVEKKEDYFIVDFSLPKGSYATTVIDYLFS